MKALALALAVAGAFAFDLRVPFRSDGAGGKNPKGDAHGRVSFFDETWMSRRKIPPAQWTQPAQRAGRVGRACFLWATFLCTSKEELFNSRMAGQGGSRPEGERKPLILFPPLLWLSLDVCTNAIVKGAKPEAKHESGSLKAELSPLLRRSELLLFARAKRSNQEKARPCLRALRTCGTPGPLRRRDFSTRHPCRVEKRRTSLCAALRVFPVGSVAAEGDLKSKAQEPRHKRERERERKRCSNEKRPASAGRPWATAGCRTGYATVDERSAAMRSSSGG